jgi:hypothetical protein
MEHVDSVSLAHQTLNKHLRNANEMRIKAIAYIPLRLVAVCHWLVRPLSTNEDQTWTMGRRVAPPESKD